VAMVKRLVTGAEGLEFKRMTRFFTNSVCSLGREKGICLPSGLGKMEVVRKRSGTPSLAVTSWLSISNFQT